MKGQTEGNKKSAPRIRAALPLAPCVSEVEPPGANSCAERELVRETASGWEIAV